MADTNINEINEAADNGTFLQAAFEVIVSNSKNNDTQNVTGVAVDGSGNPIQAVSGNIYVIDDTTLNEGYTAASLKNTNTVYMKLSAKSAVDGRPGDHTGLYVHNTYDVNKLTDGSLVVNFPGKTLGLVTLAGERSDYTELIVGEKYKFAISNFYEATTYAVGNTFAVKNGVWKQTTLASITAGDVYGELKKISSFTEGGLYAGTGYVLEIKRKAVADTVGSIVVANPTLAGTEPDLTGLEVDGSKFKVPTELPSVTASDNGKVLGVVDGDWDKVNNVPIVVTYTKSNVGVITCDTSYNTILLNYFAKKPMIGVIDDRSSDAVYYLSNIMLLAAPDLTPNPCFVWGNTTASSPVVGLLPAGAVVSPSMVHLPSDLAAILGTEFIYQQDNYQAYIPNVDVTMQSGFVPAVTANGIVWKKPTTMTFDSTTGTLAITSGGI